MPIALVQLPGGDGPADDTGEWGDGAIGSSRIDLEREPAGALARISSGHATRRGLNVSWQGVSISMMPTVADGRGKPQPRVVLHNCTGSALPSRLLAVMGPSGSGKTTLLNVLAARLETAATIEGEILFDGCPYRTSDRRLIGFVTQDDLLYACLTVHETLWFAASVRLPLTMTRHDKEQRVQGIIDALSLNKSRGSIIGDALRRGISGGERKRVSIACELMADPPALMLDEPTSGLDSNLAHSLLLQLKALAGAGRTVITTIHQPSSRMYDLVDDLLLLTEGRTIYGGEASSAGAYLASIGLKPGGVGAPPSLPEFLLDVAAGESGDTGGDVAAHADRLAESWAAFAAASPPSVVVPRAADFLPRSAPPLLLPGRTKGDAGDRGAGPAVPWGAQVRALLIREIRNRRFAALDSTRILQVALITLFAAITWWRVAAAADPLSPITVSDLSGFLFFVASFWAFLPVFSAIFAFPESRALLRKDRRSGLYGVSAFYVAYTLADLPLELLLPTCFLLALYFAVGFVPSAAAFFASLLVLLLAVLVGASIGLFISSLASSLKEAQAAASIFVMFLFLAGGFLAKHLPAAVSWIRDISFISYLTSSLADVHLTGRTVECGQLAPCPLKGSSLAPVDLQGWHGYGLGVAFLFIQLFAFRAATYLVLRRRK